MALHLSAIASIHLNSLQLRGGEGPNTLSCRFTHFYSYTDYNPLLVKEPWLLSLQVQSLILHYNRESPFSKPCTG